MLTRRSFWKKTVGVSAAVALPCSGSDVLPRTFISTFSVKAQNQLKQASKGLQDGEEFCCEGCWWMRWRGDIIPIARQRGTYTVFQTTTNDGRVIL